MPDTETSVHRFPQRLAIRVPMGLPRAVEVAATLQFTSPSEYLRRAVLHALLTDGVRLSADGHVEPHITRARRKGTRSICSAPASIGARP